MKQVIPNLAEAQKLKLRELLALPGAPQEAIRRHCTEYLQKEFGVQISPSTFARIKRTFQIEDSLYGRAEIRAAAAALAPRDAIDLRSASLNLLREKAFQFATSDDPAELQLSLQILQQIERLEKSSLK